MSPFEWQSGFSLPIFTKEECEVGVLAAEQFVQCCRKAWQKACASLLTTTRQQVADCKRHPAPTFQPGQWVWLSANDLVLHLESKKLAPRYVRSFKGSLAYMVGHLFDSSCVWGGIQYLSSLLYRIPGLCNCSTCCVSLNNLYGLHGITEWPPNGAQKVKRIAATLSLLNWSGFLIGGC
ncbi:hypothetical protein SRHO_G00050430 [Serrasalmus rhombeus]